MSDPFDSDAKTPEEQVRQILNIAAILPGQAPHRQFSIPSRNNSVVQVPTQSASQDIPGSPKPAPQQPPPHLTENLIDLDEPAAPPKKDFLSPTSSQKEEMMKGAPPPKILNSVPAEPSNGKSLKRLDSDTKEEDEFHDAHS